jgi:hypothetical protein
MPPKKKEYVRFGSTKFRIPAKMVGIDSKDKPHLYKTITPTKRLSYHNKKPAIDLTVNNNTKIKINRVPRTTQRISFVEKKKTRKPRQPRIAPIAQIAPPPPPPPPFNPPQPPAPRPPPPPAPRPEPPPYQPPPRPPPNIQRPPLPVRAVPQPWIGIQQPPPPPPPPIITQEQEQKLGSSITGAFKARLARRELENLRRKEQAQVRIANLFGRVSTNFLEADRQNVKLDIAKGQAQQALNILLAKQEASISDKSQSEKKSKSKRSIEKRAIKRMQIIKVKKEPIKEVQVQVQVQAPEIKQAVIQMQQQMKAITQSQELAKISKESKKVLKKMTEEQKKQFKDLEKQEQLLQKAIQKKIQETAKSTNAIISGAAVIQKQPPTIEQQQQSALLLQKVIRGHKGRLITSEEVSKIIVNTAANRIKLFILRRRLFKIIYSLIPQDIYKDLFEEEEKKLRAAEKRKKALSLLQVEELKIMEKNKLEMEEIYRKAASSKKIKERKPKLINEDDPVSVILFEERIGDYSAKILQSRLRTNKNLINMAIERLIQIERERERENQQAIQSINVLFNTIWIDPDAEVKSSDVKKIQELKVDTKETVVKAEEIKSSEVVKPKKKVMSFPKPID